MSGETRENGLRRHAVPAFVAAGFLAGLGCGMWLVHLRRAPSSAACGRSRPSLRASGRGSLEAILNGSGGKTR